MRGELRLISRREDRFQEGLRYVSSVYVQTSGRAYVLQGFHRLHDVQKTLAPLIRKGLVSFFCPRPTSFASLEASVDTLPWFARPGEGPGSIFTFADAYRLFEGLASHLQMRSELEQGLRLRDVQCRVTRRISQSMTWASAGGAVGIVREASPVAQHEFRRNRRMPELLRARGMASG
jgi:hypothetical protein